MWALQLRILAGRRMSCPHCHASPCKCPGWAQALRDAERVLELRASLLASPTDRSPRDVYSARQGESEVRG
jgi:hypothetical protein